MSGWKTSQIIERPIDVVWARLVDLDAASGWMTGVERVEIVDDDGVPVEDPPPLAAGTRYHFFARGGIVSGRVRALEPRELVELAANHGGVLAVYRYALSDLDGDRTRVELHAWCDAPGFWRLFHPLLDFLMRRSDGDQLIALARLVEASD